MPQYLHMFLPGARLLSQEAANPHSLKHAISSTVNEVTRTIFYIFKKNPAAQKTQIKQKPTNKTKISE